MCLLGLGGRGAVIDFLKKFFSEFRADPDWECVLWRSFGTPFGRRCLLVPLVFLPFFLLLLHLQLFRL
jgi:hypothetical protein